MVCSGEVEEAVSLFEEAEAKIRDMDNVTYFFSCKKNIRRMSFLLSNDSIREYPTRPC